MIAYDDIAAFEADVEDAKATRDRLLDKAKGSTQFRRFNAQDEVAWLKAAAVLRLYEAALEAGMDAAGEIARDLRSQGDVSMSVHEGPAKASEMQQQ